jgi:hypothetical protein
LGFSENRITLYKKKKKKRVLDWIGGIREESARKGEGFFAKEEGDAFVDYVDGWIFVRCHDPRLRIHTKVPFFFTKESIMDSEIFKPVFHSSSQS